MWNLGWLAAGNRPVLGGADTGKERAYREAISSRYEANYRFRQLLHRVDLFCSLPALLVGYACTIIIARYDCYGIGRSWSAAMIISLQRILGWGVLPLWTGLWVVITTYSVQHDLRRKKYEWYKGSTVWKHEIIAWYLVHTTPIHSAFTAVVYFNSGQRSIYNLAVISPGRIRLNVLAVYSNYLCLKLESENSLIVKFSSAGKFLIAPARDFLSLPDEKSRRVADTRTSQSTPYKKETHCQSISLNQSENSWGETRKGKKTAKNPWAFKGAIGTSAWKRTRTSKIVPKDVSQPYKTKTWHYYTLSYEQFWLRALQITWPKKAIPFRKYNLNHNPLSSNVNLKLYSSLKNLDVP